MSSRKEQKEQARQERIAAEQAAKAAAARGRRMTIIGAVVGGAAIVVVAAVLISLSGGTVKNATGATEINERLEGIPQSGFVLGKPDAPVTMVEFADLKCPYCRDFSEKSLPTLITDYVKTGKLRVEFRVQTFVADQVTPGDSMKAATAATAAGLQNKLWNFVEIFYKNQKEEMQAYATDDWLREIGGQVPGLDIEKMMTDRKNPKVTDQIDESADKFSEAGFTGTPSFLLGKTGEELEEFTYTGLDDPDEFGEAIDELLK